MSPLETIKKEQFKTQFSFEKLLKVLRYMKNLDEKTRDLFNRTEKFDFLIDFNKN